MKRKKITPSQLSLFSRSPVVGAWWNELRVQGLFKDKLPERNELENQLLKDGIRHEELLIANLKKQGCRIAELEGKQTEIDYQSSIDAMAEGYDYIWQASLNNKEMRGTADLLKKIKGSSPFGDWTYQPIECKLSSKTKTTPHCFYVRADTSRARRAAPREREWERRRNTMFCAATAVSSLANACASSSSP